MATVDPGVIIEEERLAPSGEQCYVRYRRNDGQRWEVVGVCVRKGLCLRGAVDPPLGPRRFRDDVPLGPNYDGSCCPLTVRMLGGH